MGRAEPKIRVLFLCTGNSCRSQMAEGWARALKGAEVDAYSGGTRPQALNPLAVRAMAEAGVDISSHASKRAGDLGVPFDVVVTVCDAAHGACPTFPGARVVHVGFDDPPRLAKDAASTEEAMRHYRRVRDEIRAFIDTIPGSLTSEAGPAHRTTLQEIHMTTEKKTSCCGPDCCGGTKVSAPASTALADPAADDAVREQVRAGYAKIAQSGSWSAAQATGVESAPKAG